LTADAQVARRRITLRDRPRRSLEERVLLRFPWVAAAITRAVFRLPPGSKIRQALVDRFARLGFAALNRGDFAASFMTCHRDLEFITPPRLVGLGFEPVYRGVQARIEFQRRWMADWGDMRFEPGEVLDLGDRLLFLGSVRGSGMSSGAGFESENWAVLYIVAGGSLVSEQPFFDRGEALEAAGLSST
jgi:ketosteroid isomerase-like protein